MNTNKKSQLQWTIDQLTKYGEVSRNNALNNYITRIASRILDCKKLGYQFKTEKRNGDYIYKLVQAV